MDWLVSTGVVVAALALFAPGCLGCGSPSEEDVEKMLNDTGYYKPGVDCTKSGNLAGGQATYWCNANDLESDKRRQFCVAH